MCGAYGGGISGLDVVSMGIVVLGCKMELGEGDGVVLRGEYRARSLKKPL
jgi:hypothetical protein